METLKRVNGWRTRLYAVIDTARKQRFAWGTHDCALFSAGDCVKAMTGTDPAEDLRGTYSTAAGAIKAIKGTGSADLAALAAARFPEIHPSQAAVGDLMSIPADDTGWALGICIGERVGVLSPTGYATVERSKATKAFKVG